MNRLVPFACFVLMLIGLWMGLFPQSALWAFGDNPVMWVYYTAIATVAFSLIFGLVHWIKATTDKSALWAAFFASLGVLVATFGLSSGPFNLIPILGSGAIVAFSAMKLVLSYK